MHRLWQAAIQIARLDDKTWKQILDTSEMVKRGDLCAVFFDPQPSFAAMQGLDEILRSKGLMLPVYIIGEINRWAHLEKTKGGVIDALRTYVAAVDSAGQTGRGFEEAAGMMLIDQDYRTSFRDGALQPMKEGFDLTEEQQEALRSVMKTNGEMHDASAAFFALGWDGASCLTRFRTYKEYLHVNL